MRSLLLALSLVLAAAPGCARAGAGDQLLAGAVQLGEGATLVPLRRTQATGGTLVISGLAWDAPPGVIYEVHLQSRDGRRAPLGTISFYNETAGAGSGERRFDAAAALRALGGDVAGLVLVPSSGLAGTPPPRVNPLSHMRFSAVTLIP